jgi:hypothetical protein
VFAGAAREAVFSRPEVIRRVNAAFVPVALKAGLVNNPPAGEEGDLYREIARSRPAPQGICVVNSAGKVLDWALMFDDDRSALAFLDHCVGRFARFPDARKPVDAERYMKFPSVKLDDVADNGKVVALPERHPPGKGCPATPRSPLGTVAVRLYGRALAPDGKPVADALRQEHYVEDRFNVPVGMQEALARAVAGAGAERFRLGDDLTRLLVSHAYLGQLDVNPVGPPGGKGDLKQCEFWARKVEGGDGAVRLRVEGKSEAAGASRDGEGGDGRLWQHEVKLTWEGLIEMRDGRITRLLLVARGNEKLKWGNALRELKGEADIAHLPAGRAIDLACEVRYGVVGAPIPADEAGPAEAEQEPPAEVRRHLVEALGAPFLVFRDKAQAELMLSEEQKQKLAKELQATAQDATTFFQKLQGLRPDEREKELHAYRQKAHEKLAAFLRGALNGEQLDRLRQLELQHEGLFALGRPDLMMELKLTDTQRQQFMTLVQEVHEKVMALVKEAQTGGKPEELPAKVMKLRKEQAAKIEALLTPTQKEQWQKMLGKPVDLGD